MQTIVVGTHQYQWALWPLGMLYHKYWSADQLLWYGDRQEGDLPHNVEFCRVPCYTEGSWPWEHWFANGLRSILEELKSRVVALLLPDHWFSAKVDRGAVNLLARYMERNPDVVRGNLTAGTCLAWPREPIKSYNKYSIVQAHPNGPCSLGGGMTFCPSLWGREALLALLEPHWNLWACETVGTQKMARLWPRWRSVGIEPAPVRRVHGLVHSVPRTVNLSGFSEEDRAAVRAMLPGGWDVLD